MKKHLSSHDLAHLVAELAGDKKGFDIKIIKVGEVIYFADYFVVVSGNTDKQVKAILDHVLKELRDKKVRPIGVEGEKECDWVLVDLGEVILHIFQKELREYYSLERLWADVEIEEVAEEAPGARSASE